MNIDSSGNFIFRFSFKVFYFNYYTFEYNKHISEFTKVKITTTIDKRFYKCKYQCTQ